MRCRLFAWPSQLYQNNISAIFLKNLTNIFQYLPPAKHCLAQFSADWCWAALLWWFGNFCVKHILAVNEESTQRCTTNVKSLQSKNTWSKFEFLEDFKISKICEIFKLPKGISAMFGLLYYTHGVHLISFTVFVACSLTLPTSKVVGISLCVLKKQMRSFLTTSHKCFETHLSAKCLQTHLHHMLFLIGSHSFI